MARDEKFIKALGKHIDKLRKEKGLSMAEMALACDMERAQVFKLSKNGLNLTASTLLQVAKGLDVPVSELFNFKYWIRKI